ncbi:MAG: DUF72 domain-containing protein [Chitinophagaceae bacterium]
MSAIAWRIGCSGFHYADWKEVFYPAGLPQKKWFDFYCQHFNTLELNVTFYRFPQLKFLENWYAKSPEGFDFSVKVPRAITHYKQFIDTERMLDDFYGTSREGLKDKLGCILFQMPARLQYSEAALDRITAQLHPGFTNILEFRHESWWNEKVYNRLAANNTGFCGHSYPGLPETAVCNVPLIYYRFHGVPKVYYSQYKRAFIEQVVGEVEACSQVSKAYIYFNNTATMAAIRNARYLQALVGPARDKAQGTRNKGVS